MNLKPIGTQILVQLDKQTDENVLSGGLYIPSKIAEDGPTRGTVIALGSGVNHRGQIIPFNVKIGDRVLFPRYAEGVIVKYDNETYCIIKEDGLLAIVEENE